MADNGSYSIQTLTEEHGWKEKARATTLTTAVLLAFRFARQSDYRKEPKIAVVLDTNERYLTLVTIETYGLQKNDEIFPPSE